MSKPWSRKVIASAVILSMCCIALVWSQDKDGGSVETSRVTFMRVLVRSLLAIVIAVMTLWGIAALYFSPLLPPE